MTSRASSTSALIASIIVAILLWTWTRFADLWAPSVTFYAGVVIFLSGLLSVVVPLRFIGIRTRGSAARILLAGVVIAAGAILWPVPAGVESAHGSTELDRVLPEFHRHEKHEILVPGSIERVRQAMDQVTLSDIRGMRTLMSIRTMKQTPVSHRPVLAAMTGPGSNFRQLASTNAEFVAGNIGRPWENGGPIPISDADHFRDFAGAGYAKIAFNMRVDAAEPGWCKVTTETRILATDEVARRAFTRYWRVVYPGSALIRLMWLDALRRRLEPARA